MNVVSQPQQTKGGLSYERHKQFITFKEEMGAML